MTVPLMTARVVQARWLAGGGTATVSGSLASPTTAGNCLVYAMNAYGGSAASDISVAGATLGGQADNFSQAVSARSDPGQARTMLAAIWVDPNCRGGQTAVAATVANGTFTGSGGMAVYEVEGAASAIADLIDQIAAASGQSQTAVSSGLTPATTDPDGIVIGACGAFNAMTAIGQAGTTPAGAFTVLTGNAGGAGYRVPGATGQFGFGGTQATANTWAACAVALKTPPPPPPPEPILPPTTPGPSPAEGPIRTYDLTFNRRYVPVTAPVEPPPEPPGGGIVTPPVSGAENLVPVIWDGLELQANEFAGSDVWFTAVVELVTGWYASPPLDGRDVERALADGSVWGNKLLRAREVTITGAVVGPRRRIIDFRDQLAARAAARTPAELVIGDPQLGTSLTAMVRADSDSLTHEFFAGPVAYRYQVVVTAADPLLFDREWQQVTLSTGTAADAGRVYERRYDTPPAWSEATEGWGYESPYPAGSAAYMTNAGNAPAPVYASYEGDLAASRLTDETSSILMEPLAAGVELFVATATLATEGPGGASRAQWIRPGSRPMWIPANSTARWHLYSQGSGRVTLSWRSSWV